MVEMTAEPGKKNSGTFVVAALVIIGLVIGGLFALGFIPRIGQTIELRKAHQETVDAVPRVIVVTAEPASNKEQLVLPGNIGAIQYTTIYARIDGYLKSRYVDIGDYVKQGQLLAEIDTPTVDEKVAQGRADVVEAKAVVEKDISSWKEAKAKQETAAAEIVRAKANNNYADVTANRWKNMATRGAVSLQSRDEKVRSFESTSADVEVANANYKAATDQVSVAKSQIDVANANVVAKEANLARLLADQAFKRVVAPFDGIITLRKVDPGALITQGSQTSSLELFQMAKIDTVRIYVNAPQRVARYLHPGIEAIINVPEYPERKFVAKVTNVSGGLDPNTRTRQTEIRIANPDHVLLPGMYAEVRMTDLRESQWIRVPGTTIVTENDGLYVVVVKNGKAHYQRVQLGRDFGDEVEIKLGLSGGEKIVVSPSDDLLEGDAVSIGAEKSEEDAAKSKK
ncbi:MAG TPA: efflux RND transporter periplasmic adaptor subunit [Oculatellaceae cyanobacterium]